MVGDQLVLTWWNPSTPTARLEDGVVLWPRGHDPIAVSARTGALLQHLDSATPLEELLEDLAAATGEPLDEVRAVVTAELAALRDAPAAPKPTWEPMLGGIRLHAGCRTAGDRQVLVTAPGALEDRNAADEVLLAADGTIRRLDHGGWRSGGSSVFRPDTIVWAGTATPTRAMVVAALLEGSGRGNDLHAARVLRRVTRLVERLPMHVIG